MIKEEYLKFIMDIYNEINDDMEEVLGDVCWTYSEPPEKTKIINKLEHIDATNLKINDIKSKINKYNQISIGNFLIHIKQHEYCEINKLNLYSFYIYENIFTLPSGRSCNVLTKIDTLKDIRFKARPWLTYFKRDRMAYQVPENTLIDIIRWLQAICKLLAFI